jgi:hypothetical protein
VRKTYRNPVALALEWRRAIATGRYQSRADLAKEKGISHARVTQLPNLLRLSPKVIEIIRRLGDPLLAHTVTERQLRRLINLPAQDQVEEISVILGAALGGMEPMHHS